jgi:hypothetical protein
LSKYLLRINRKTELAVNFVHRLHRQDPNTSIFWISGETLNSFVSGLAEIAKLCWILGLENPDWPDDESIISFTTHWLREEENGRWLMVVDNVHKPNMRPNAAGDWLLQIPKCTHGSVLFITRERDATESLDAIPVSVDDMTEGESCALLRSRLPTEMDNESLVQLATIAKGSPATLIRIADVYTIQKASAQGQTQVDTASILNMLAMPQLPSSTVPYRRDLDFVYRGTLLEHIEQKCGVAGAHVALQGMGGVG